MPRNGLSFAACNPKQFGAQWFKQNPRAGLSLRITANVKHFQAVQRLKSEVFARDCAETKWGFKLKT